MCMSAVIEPSEAESCHPECTREFCQAHPTELCSARSVRSAFIWSLSITEISPCSRCFAGRCPWRRCRAGVGARTPPAPAVCCSARHHATLPACTGTEGVCTLTWRLFPIPFATTIYRYVMEEKRRGLLAFLVKFSLV